MARTPEGAALTEAHRQLQLRLLRGLVLDIARLWEPVDPADMRGTLEPWTKAAELATVTRRTASATAAQRYYAAFRTVEGVQGSVAFAGAPEVEPAVLRGGLFGAAASGIINARRRGASLEEAKANGLVKASGSAVQIAANGGRAVLLNAIKADPAAIGYQRVTDGDPCAFCRMIASRGIIAYDEMSASFESHAHCGCTAEPAFEGSAVRAQNAAYRREWDEATGGLSGADALRAYRQSLAGNPST